MIDMDTQVPDRVAPSSPEAEEAVLGSVLVNHDVLLDLAALLAPGDFFLVRNNWIYAAMLSIHERQEDVDELTLSEELRLRGQLESVGGPAYLAYLGNSTPTHIHAETYANIILRAAIRRSLLGIAQELAQTALDDQGEIEPLLEKSAERIEGFAARRSVQRRRSGPVVVSEAIDQFLEWTSAPAEIRGLRCGIPKLDRFLGGFGKGRVYTLYGATGVGKSTLATAMAVNFMEQAPGIIIPTEMDPEFWIHRAVSDLAGIDYRKLESGPLTAEENDRALSIYNRFHRLRHCFQTLGSSNPTPADLKALVRQARRQGACQWVLVDSVNNIRIPGVTDIYTQTSLAADAVLSVAYDDVMVLTTSQTGRNAKGRDDKKPRLNDAEGSGKIEQNSHVVLGIYRHDYYVDRGEAQASAAFPEGRTLLMMLKNRTGLSGKQAFSVQFVAGRGWIEDNRQTVNINEVGESRDASTPF